MSDNCNGEECCSDSVLTSTDDEVIDIRIVSVIILTVIFVRIFDYISHKVNINFIVIMGNLFSRLTGNCSNPEEDNKSQILRLKSEPQSNTGSQTNVPEIRKHSSTPLKELKESTPKQLQKTSAKPLLAKHPDKSFAPKEERRKNVDKEKTLYTTTFETQVDAAPPHPLEEKYQDVKLDEIEIDTNIFAPEVEDAVVKIQAGFRGYLARKHVHELKKDIEDNALANYEEEIAVVPPPKNFENLSPSNDLDNWKRLSQHLEEKVSEIIEDEPPVDEMIVQRTINGPLTEAVIPLNDSNDNKVIETYVCKENILDVEPTEEQPVFSKIKTADERVVDKVFNVLMAETESESIINFIETNKSRIETQIVDPIKGMVSGFISDKTDDNSQESEVLANLNAILDSENDIKPKEDNNQTLAEEQPNEESFQSTVAEMLSKTTTQQIIRNSFNSFVREMTATSKTIDSEPHEVKIEEIVAKPEEPPIQLKPEEVVEIPKVEERKTDSMLFEEDVVQTIFDEELTKNQTKNQIFAIELFKDDVKEEQLANVTTLCEPEPTVRNIWGVEEKACKTSIEQFVVKPVEPQTPVEPLEEVFTSEPILESIPMLETEQKIEVISSQSRKNSEDLLESDVITNEEPLIETEEEVVPMQSPIIQVEEQNGNVLDEEEAAIRIQAAFRGYQIRRSMSREASPNRSTNHNNNTDSNNNNHNNGANDNDIEFNETAVQWIESTLQQTNNELSVDYNLSEQLLDTNEISVDNSTQMTTASVEQIDTSLEKLEYQLMNELISSAEEEERTQALLNDNLDIIQQLDDLESGELTAPLLLQRIQQSMSSNASNVDPEEKVPEVVEQTSENAPIDAQTAVEKEVSNVVEDTPLIQKSDTIIMDLMSSSPQTINYTTIDSDLSPVQDNPISGQLIESEAVVKEELSDSPIIVSELLKSDSQPNIPDTKAEEVIEKIVEVTTESSKPQISEEPRPDSIEVQNPEPIEETKTQISENVKTRESQLETTQIQESVPIFEPIQNSPIDNLVQDSIETEPAQTVEPVPLISDPVDEIQEPVPLIPEPILQSQETVTQMPEPLPETPEQVFEAPEPDQLPEPEILRQEPTQENIESLQSLSIGALEKEVDLQQSEMQTSFQSNIEPPTPDLENVREITPELSFIQSSKQAVLTKICSSESEQESETPVIVDTMRRMSSDRIVESRPSMIPVLESSNKPKSSEQTDIIFKRPKPILKEKESKIYTNIIPDEQTHSTSEEISSPDDENPEFVGLGPNTPIPVRASSPNPFGKKRRRGKKGTGPRK